MTVKQARKLLGKEAKHLTDEEILSDIEVAELLKNLFFNHHLKHNKKVDIAKHSISASKFG